MATLKDVAKLACVDVSTVSRALNGTSYVHPETKARIYAAVKELSYRPNVLAQALRQGKRHTIGLVVPRLDLTTFADILQGAEREASKHNYATLICHTDDNPKTERECLNRLRNGFVDGIAIAGTGRCTRLLRDIQSNGLPIVQVIRRQDAHISSVVADYDACGYDAVKYLATKGCRQIGLINGDENLAPYRERYIGFHRAMTELGLPETTALFLEPGNSFEYGYRCAEALLNQNPMLDAIMVAVDVQGIGAMRALKERDRRVPQDVRLISLTGHAIGGVLETPMTALEIPAYEMGAKAARMLIDEIEAPEGSKPAPQHLTFPAVLVERESG
ncbi:LacI family DNA-binding transcriptional regulator [Enterocloster citroniae]|uniref:LacI family DNA-binding transcriptional regulator n=1 Tax=Enterocloster citroniae TaxID=358743 RepID=A0AA41K8L8_9FIRM|nr:LacI family DNA-binding transcriptional regulator [Enterocloster citroniae]MBT9812442.1 LacI family DNA-binding transcriptional regulator [Enterocloster citroniae]